MRERDSSRKRKGRETKRRKSHPVTWAALLIFAFGLLSLIGLFGDTLHAFFAGAFGFMGYPFFALAFLFALARAFGFLRKRFAPRTLIYAFLLSVILLTYLQVMTSFAEYQEMTSPTYDAYIDVCYEAGVGTSGGVLFAWIAHPLISLMGRYAAIPLAVFFFVLLFFAMLPMMRGAKDSRGKEGADVRKKPSRKAEKKSAVSAQANRPLRLFVEKVNPREKDAQKIKFKGFFAKRPKEPEFFDVYDNRPLTTPEGIVPESRAERYDAYAGDRMNGREPMQSEYSREEYPFDDLPRAEYTRSDRRIPQQEEETEDLPAFVRRFAGERAEAKRKLYGEEDVSAIIPDEPSYDSVAASDVPRAVANEKAIPSAIAPKNPMPKAAPHRPKARVDDIIQDMSDLARIREQESGAPKRKPFLGENPVASVTEDVPTPEDSFCDRYSEPKDVPSTEEIPEPPLSSYGSRETITPRESSFLSPQEERRTEATTQPSFLYPKRAPEPSVKPFEPPMMQEQEEFVRTRKTRSDIGGTHRTQDAEKPVNTYIPPKKAEQMNITQMLKEEEEAPARPYTPPPVSLLKDFPPVQDEGDVEERAEMLVQALASFNISSEVIDHKTGPTFTQFAVTLPDNMSVNKLTPLEKDIKRKLKVDKNIRIIPSVAGLDAVGIEVPNKKTSMVGLRSIINSPDFAKEGKLFFAIGVDVSGRAVYGDLLKMPHLLVAGTTGSGKSVCLNVMICSMMYHYSPEVVRFIMVDPKKVELAAYKDMPHMLMPSTITEPDKAINALTWAVAEMERRYLLLMENGCRNIGEYNAMQKKTGGKRLYYIVFIIDEMADLMYTVKREVEEKVNRLAAKARAAGIHLVVATQRPSVDVITGTIKNNIPTRIAFRVTSFTDSKTILDRGGAESLFGNGDMLYCPPDGGDPIRLQGPFINEEISEIVSYVKEHNDCRFDGEAERIIQSDKPDPAEVPSGEGDEEGDGEDELFAPALLYFIKIGQASISKLQIKFHIGYGRAARIVETMAEMGYLGKAEGGNKSRQVTITQEQYYELYGEDGIDGEEV